MNIPKSNIGINNVGFSGHNKKLDKTGYEVHKFYYIYDPEKYKCKLELYNIIRDDKGNIQILTPQKPQYDEEMENFSIEKDMSEIPQINSNIGFAYRFRLEDQKTHEISYAFDNGTVVGIFDDKKENKYNVVLNNRAAINKNGPMQLIMPDGYYPGIEKSKEGNAEINQSLRAKVLTTVRNHANKLGGNFYGIIARLPELRKEGIKRIVGTPYTKDTISSHKYWTENAYQISPEFGNENDFKKLQIELFKNDINWIADAALVNEGLNGIHISELLRKGQESFSKNMFRADERPALGIIPDKCEYTRMKIINAPFKVDKYGAFEENNPDYNPSKPTYIQFYDDRLASKEQKESDSPIDLTTYANKNTSNIYDITKHDDAVYPVPIEVNPDELARNAKNIAKRNKVIDLSDVNTMKSLSDFTNFHVETKSYAGGLEVWDGNVDIPKLNFYRNVRDDERFSKLPPDDRETAIKDFDKGSLAVRDYAINSGKYWTKLTTDTLIGYVAGLLQDSHTSYMEYKNKIDELADAGKLPPEAKTAIDKEIVSNVVDDYYHSRFLDDADMRSYINPEGYGNKYSLKDYILKQAMDCPLETLPFASNLLGVLTGPYIEKKASTEDELGVSRYDLFKAGNPNLDKKYRNVYSQADKLYSEGIAPIITEILDGTKNEEVIPNIKNGDQVTDLGKYIINEITPDLTKYILIKAINPNADIKISKDGEFDFSNVKESEYTIQSLGIPYSGKSLEEESQIVVNILKQGLINFKASKDEIVKLQDAVKTRFKDRRLKDYKIAEMIIDRLEAGQGWRIDASKDIAAIDSVRADTDGMTKAWNNVIDFWKRYNEAILQYNPHAYTTAEITDLYDLFKNEVKTVFTSDADAERKFLEATGITAVANYNYFFSLLPELYSSYNFENGNENWQALQGKNFELRDKLDAGWSGTNPGFLFQSPDDGVVNSYTFVGNHDKPRVLHCLALDMGLFNFAFNPAEIKESLRIKNSLKDKTNLSEKETEQLQNVEKKIKYYNEAAVCLGKSIDKITDKDSAKAVAMGTRLRSAFYNVLKENDLTKDVDKAIRQIANGSFKGKSFDADAFGTRPIEIAIRSVLDQVEYNGVKIKDREKIEAQVLEDVLTPAFDRFYSIYKLLTVLPGSPTDFAGDRVAATGYETKAKNYHQQNRNVIHWEWLNDPNYKFVRTFYDNLNNISKLRSNPKLSALNNGATVTLPVLTGTKNKDGKTDIKTDEKLQAFLRYDDNNSIVFVLNDLSGASSDFDSKMNRTETNTSTENNIYNRIILSSEHMGLKQGLKHGSKELRFRNAREEDKSIYRITTMTIDGKEYYYLKREDDKGAELPITIKPEDLNTLILYKI